MKKNNLFFIASVFMGVFLFWIFSYKKATVDHMHATLVVGTNSEFPPFSFQEEGKLVGFDIDVITEIAHRLGKELIFKDLPFETLIPEIQLGNVHVIAAGMSPTPERRAVVFFTEQLFYGSPLTIVTLNDKSTIATPDDLSHKTVAVNEGYLADLYISQREDVTVYRISSASISEGLLALESGRADAFIASYASLYPFLNMDRSKNFLVHSIENTEELDALAVSHKYPELFSLIEQTVQHMKNDGMLDKLIKKWLSHD
jgi:polar amino acid transport system substrate-binding protein